MFTVRYANSLTGGQAFRGTFATLDEAIAYRDACAKQSRSFVSYEIWKGMPSKPISLVTGTSINGAA